MSNLTEKKIEYLSKKKFDHDVLFIDQFHNLYLKDWNQSSNQAVQFKAEEITYFSHLFEYNGRSCTSNLTVISKHDGMEFAHSFIVPGNSVNKVIATIFRFLLNLI